MANLIGIGLTTCRGQFASMAAIRRAPKCSSSAKQATKAARRDGEKAAEQLDTKSEPTYITRVVGEPLAASPGDTSMTTVKIDSEMLQRLRAVSGAVQLCDDDGRVVGYFRPACGTQRYPEPPALLPEELQRRLASPGGRKISEILADLATRS